MACEWKFADSEKIGVLMMFLPHLILANHFNQKGLDSNSEENRGREKIIYLDISDVFDCFESEKNIFFIFSFPFPHFLASEEKILNDLVITR